MSDIEARGVLYVHSAPAALCPHIEWAVGAALGARKNWNGSPNRPPPEPTVPRSIGSQRRVVGLNWRRHFVGGHICATKLLKKLHWDRMDLAGHIPQSWVFSMPRLTSPATLWSLKTAFGMPTNKPTVIPQLCTMSFRWRLVRLGTKSWSRSGRQPTGRTSVGSTA